MFISKKRAVAITQAILRLTGEAQLFCTLYFNTEEGARDLERLAKPCAQCGQQAAIEPRLGEGGKTELAAGLLCLNCREVATP